MALTKFNTDVQNIQKLADRPNQTDGLTAAQVKATYDKAGEDIKSYINDTLTVEMDTSLASKTNDLNTHKDSNDHDGRYYTETEIDGKVNVLNNTGSNMQTQITTNTNNISSNTTRITTLENGKVDKTTYDAQIINAGNSNSEVVDARGTYPKMKNRLDSVDSQMADIANNRNVLNYGIKNDGTDTSLALNNLAEGYTYIFPAGVYGVKGFNGVNAEGLKVKNNTKYIFLPGARIKVLTNNSIRYAGISITNVTNFEIVNPVVEGDRASHDFTSGGTHEWGHGILAQGVCIGKIVDAYCYDTTGDGIDIITSTGSDIKIIRGRSNNVRRNGLSIESADILFVEDFISENTNGTIPQLGIDIEPFTGANVLNNIILKNCICKNNASGGVGVVWVDLPPSYNITLDNCIMDGLRFDGVLPNTKGNIVFNNPQIVGGAYGIINTCAPNAIIKAPIIKLDSSKINLGNFPGAIYMFNTKTTDFVVGSIDIIDAQIENDVASGLIPINFFVPTTGSQIKQMKDINITVKKNNIAGKSIVINTTRDFVNCNIGTIPNAVYDRPTGWANGNGSAIVRKYITNKGATANQNYDIWEEVNLNLINEITFEVVSPYRITIRTATGTSALKILPFGTNTVYSESVGAKIKLKYAKDVSGNGMYYVIEMIGTWIGV